MAARSLVAAALGAGCLAFMLPGVSGASSSASASRALAGFAPVSFTAVSESQYWLLGTYRCSGRRACFTILHTTDGGRRFSQVNAPQLPLTGITPYLRFADSRDGYAYVQWSTGALYSTHDGGATWQRLRLGTVLAFATGGGNAFLVTGRCTLSRCSDYRLQRSPISKDAWTSQPTPFALGASIVGLAAHGPYLWLLGTPGSAVRLRHDVLARSADGGRTWAIGPGPCFPDLGGSLQPASASVLWAVCPTGLLAGAWRSIDGGATFAPLKTRGLVNSAVLAPASDSVAVLAANGAGAPLLRTTDGGATWHAVPGTRKADSWPFIGFTNASVGTAIVTTGTAGANSVWRTTDAGATWQAVRLGVGRRW